MKPQAPPPLPKYREGLFYIWDRYKYFIEKRTTSSVKKELNSMEVWRNKLFTNFITYVLPSCLIALVPGVYMSLTNGFVIIAVCDMLAVVLIAFGSLNSFMSLGAKKILVISVLYLLSCMLTIYLSLLGPGLVYLLTLSVVISITCKSRWAYGTVALNLLMCIVCALLIHFRLLDTALVKDYSLAVWITVSSNLVFLSFVIVILIRKAIKVLEKTIDKEQLLKMELYQKNLHQFETNKLLIESEGHYKSLFYQNPSSMWILDRDTFQFLQVNESAIRNYGYTKDEFLTMNIWDIKMKQEKESIKDYLKENEQTGNPLSLVTQHIRKNKEPFYVEVIFNTIPFMGKSAILAISNDMSEQMNYLKSIQNQNEQLKEIAWIQCHKVRAPLATILGLVALYRQGIPDVEYAEIMNGIVASAEQLDEVIKETVAKSSPSNLTIIPGS